MSANEQLRFDRNSSSGQLVPIDPDLRRELATIFLEYCPKLLKEIRVAMKAHDVPQLRFVAHTLKGSAGVFNAQAAFDAASRLERVGGEGDWCKVEEVWQAVENEMASLSSLLADYAKHGC